MFFQCHRVRGFPPQAFSFVLLPRGRWARGFVRPVGKLAGMMSLSQRDDVPLEFESPARPGNCLTPKRAGVAPKQTLLVITLIPKREGAVNPCVHAYHLSKPILQESSSLPDPLSRNQRWTCSPSGSSGLAGASLLPAARSGLLSNSLEEAQKKVGVSPPPTCDRASLSVQEPAPNVGFGEEVEEVLEG